MTTDERLEELRTLAEEQLPTLDGEAYTRTLTGFDEIAIHRAFGDPISRLHDGIIPRALLFVEARRAGVKDGDAFRGVMEMPLGDVEKRFTAPADDQGKARTTRRRKPGPTS